MPNIRTHYDNLQISRTASDVVIRAAYRGLSQQHHPDKNPNDRVMAERRMKIINEAYAVLSDPVRRREHDQWILEMESGAQGGQFDTTNHEATKHVISEIAVYPNNRKMIEGFLVSIIIFSCGVFMFFDDKTEHFWLIATVKGIAKYLIVLLSAFFSVYYFRWLVSLSPSIVINEIGVQVNSFFGATLRWSEISDVRIEENPESTSLLTITPINQDILIARQSFLARVVTKGRPPAILIDQDMSEMPLEMLIEEIRSRMPR